MAKRHTSFFIILHSSKSKKPYFIQNYTTLMCFLYIADTVNLLIRNGADGGKYYMTYKI